MVDKTSDCYSTMKWGSLCKFFHTLSKVSKHERKRELLTALYNKFRPNNLYPIIRLILPQHDKQRQSYGLKEKKIANMYITVLSLSPKSEDAQRLLNWKKPQGIRGSESVWLC